MQVPARSKKIPVRCHSLFHSSYSKAHRQTRSRLRKLVEAGGRATMASVRRFGLIGILPPSVLRNTQHERDHSWDA
jgi:hypothetical protein